MQAQLEKAWKGKKNWAKGWNKSVEGLLSTGPTPFSVWAKSQAEYIFQLWLLAKSENKA